MSMKESKVGLYVVGTMVFLNFVMGMYLIVSHKSNVPTLFGSNGNPIQERPTLGLNASTTVTSTVRSIVTSKSGAQLLVLSNTGISDLYYSPTSTALTVGSGILLKASSTAIFSGDSLWGGAIYAISNGTTTIGIMQL